MSSGSGPRLSSGGGSDEREVTQVAEVIQQRPELGWVQLLGRLTFWLVLDVFAGCTVYFISCGKECKGSFSGVTGNTFVDSLYFSSTTLTTTGFGDIAPTTPTSKAFTSIYIVCNTFYINYFVYPPFVRLVQIVEGRNRGFWRRFLLAVCYCLICLLSGIPFLICLGGLGWGNAFYTVVVSFSSTGYGDYTFAKMWGRVFNSLWLLVSHLVNYRLGGLVTDAGDDFLLQSRAVAGPTAAPVLDESNKSSEDAKEVANDLRDAARVLVDAKKSFEDDKKATNDLCIELLGALEEVKDLRREKIEATRDLLSGLDKCKSEEEDLQGRLGKGKIEVNDLRGRIVEARKDADNLRGQLVEARKDADDLRGQLVEARKDADDLRGRLGEGPKEAKKNEENSQLRQGPKEAKKKVPAKKPSSSSNTPSRQSERLKVHHRRLASM